MYLIGDLAFDDLISTPTLALQELYVNQAILIRRNSQFGFGSATKHLPELTLLDRVVTKVLLY
jgi:hypothetical protein